MDNLLGKKVLITGPARGIGAELARQLSAKGAQIALVGLEPELLQQLSDSLPTKSVWAQTDVCDWDSVEKAVKQSAEELGGIDAVVTNAGIALGDPIQKISREDFEKTVDVNLYGTWRTVKLALPYLLESKGYILLISSMAAAIHPPGISNYSASKAGVEAFGDSIRIDLFGTGVDVGIAHFSYLDTDMVRDGFAEAESKGADLGPKFTLKVAPLPQAVHELVKTIEQRKQRLIYPGINRGAFHLRTAMQRIVEKTMRRRKKKRS